MGGIFSNSSPFQTAVQLGTKKSLVGKRISIDNGRQIETHKIMPHTLIKTLEISTVSRLSSDYSYAFDIGEQIWANLLNNNKAKSKRFDKDTELEQLFDRDQIVHKKVFTFSKGEYSDVYSIQEDNNMDPSIQKLLEICKFSNTKTLLKLEAFKLQHSDSIEELTNENNYLEMFKIEDIFTAKNFLRDNLYAITHKNIEINTSFSQEMLSVYLPSVTKKIDLELSGIISFIDKGVFDAISIKYLWTYEQLKCKFNKKKVINYDRIIKHINIEYLPIVYARRRQEYPWLYDKSNIDHLHKIIFPEEEDEGIPALYEGNNYQYFMQKRIDQMIIGNFLVENFEKSECESLRQTNSIRHTISKKA